MGYNFYNPHKKKVSVAHHAELFENSHKCTRSEWESHFVKRYLMIWFYINGEDYELEDPAEPANH
ncbi:hypothetical protein Tco_1349973, partial [Tanacetum coccineum]